MKHLRPPTPPHDAKHQGKRYTKQERVITQLIVRLVTQKPLTQEDIDRFQKALNESKREDDPYLYDNVVKLINKWNEKNGK